MEKYGKEKLARKQRLKKDFSNNICFVSFKLIQLTKFDFK
jgi:hypothetical protein